MPYHFLLTIDVEDWFQVENFKQWIPFSSWTSCESRVEKNTHQLLDLLDAFNGKRLTVNGEQKKLRATFFTLGWIAQRVPHLVNEIRDRGHEIASHGSRHRVSSEWTSDELRKDLNDSKKLLEDITGAPVYGYRAPNFSVDDDSLKIIEDCGYLYDSSFNSFSMNERYGWLTLSGNDKKEIAHQVSDTFYEFPVSNMTLWKYIIPWGGGGYFRMIPFGLFRWGVELILKKEKSYIFYIHPWEIDPDQPRVNHASRVSKFRHYLNLDKTQSRLSNLLESFSHCRFPTCHQYLQDVESSSFGD